MAAKRKKAKKVYKAKLEKKKSTSLYALGGGRS